MKNLFSKSRIIFLVLCSMMIISNKQLSAQSQAGIVSMNVEMKLHVNPNNPADTLDPKFDIIYTLVLNDTVKVKTIHVNAGTAQGGSDIFSYDLKIKNNNNLPQGVTYNLAGNVATITVSSQYLRTDYYYQATAQDNSGNSSNPKTYHH